MDNMLLPNCVYEYIDGEYKDLKIRVLNWSQDIDALYYIELEKDQAMPQRYKLSSFLNELSRECVRLVVDPYLDCISTREESEKVQANIDDKWEVINKYWKVYEIDLLEPSNQNSALKEIVSLSGIPRHKIKRIFSQYLQRGMRENAFSTYYQNCGARGKSRNLGNKKVGRPNNPDKDGNPIIGRNVTPEIDVLIDVALQKYYFKNNALSLSDIYQKFIEENFSYKVKDGPNIAKERDSIISLEQFMYHANKKIAKQTEEDIIKRIGRLKYDLEQRILTKNATMEVDGPGKMFIIDATLGDVWLVCRDDRNKIIGRPVFYVIIDVFSRLITGIYVGLEGPSWVGASMALVNMIEDKVTFCNRIGVELKDPDMWPCKEKPDLILADRGEFIGHMPEKLVKHLNIKLENTAPYRGDLKGIVERRFRIFNGRFKRKSPGAIKADFNSRVDKDYKLHSTLDIEQIKRLFAQYVILHNNTPISKYPPHLEQIMSGIPPTPVELWIWGIANLRGKLQPVDENVFKLNLMLDARATMTREGLKFRRAFYMCDDMHPEEWIPAKNKKGNTMLDKYEVVYDARNLNYIYVVHKDHKHYDKFYLLEKSYAYKDHMEDEVIFINQLADENTAQVKQKTLQMQLDTNYYEEKILEEAKKMKKAASVDKPKTKKEQLANKTQNRAEEKESKRQEEHFELEDCLEQKKWATELVEDEIEEDDEDEVNIVAQRYYKK